MEIIALLHSIIRGPRMRGEGVAGATAQEAIIF